MQGTLGWLKVYHSFTSSFPLYVKRSRIAVELLLHMVRKSKETVEEKKKELQQERVLEKGPQENCNDFSSKYSYSNKSKFCEISETNGHQVFDKMSM
ncbi:unnamed protein product [Coffea canephora]|uniref:Uncharacterized protein n=1 Tax=Coffea canephora TaxID=49390 RepID=A0A068VAY9_COFCA|nr:unnamed protein product [Coffea canephora]